jgi:cell wall-associated NlpC family hydrolase
VEWEITFKPQQGKVFVYESGCKDTLMHACNASATSDGCISGTWPAEGSLQKAVCEGENGLEKQLADKDNKFDSDIVVKVKMSLPAQHAADKSGKDAKTGKETKYGYYIRNTVTIKGHCDDNEKTKAKATEDDKKSREYSGSGKVCVGKCSSCTRDGMVELARQMAIDNPKYYQLPLRNRKGYYDCSSFVYHALKDGCGVDLNNANCTYNTDCNPPTTYDMPKEFGKKLKEITIDQLQPGDILWKYGHTELYIGGYQSIGAHTNTRPNNQVGVTGSGKDNITRFHRFFTLEEYD